jgi:hypothetical protein
VVDVHTHWRSVLFERDTVSGRDDSADDARDQTNNEEHPATLEAIETQVRIHEGMPAVLLGAETVVLDWAVTYTAAKRTRKS